MAHWPEGLGAADFQRIEQFLDGSASENTRASYHSAWKAFTRWAQARAALAVPDSSAPVATYLYHLVEERPLSVVTAQLHRAAIATIHNTNGRPDSTDNEDVRRVLKGIARSHGRSAKQAKPLTAAALAAVRATAATQDALWETGRSRNRQRGLPGGPRWTRRSSPYSGTASCAAQRP